MKKIILALLFSPLLSTALLAQDEEEKGGGFNKENLFTGGSVTLSFFNGQTVLGANPIFGYKLTNWLDAGVAFNVQYATARDNYAFDDRIKQTILGPGVFARIYPVSMIFLQG